MYIVANYYPPGNIMGQFAQNFFDRQKFQGTTPRSSNDNNNDDYDDDDDLSSSSIRPSLRTTTPSSQDLDTLRKQLTDLFVNANTIIDKLNKNTKNQ
jgi:hypothetical protein